MGKPVAFGAIGDKFVVTRQLGTVTQPEQPSTAGDGDERESDESVAEGAGGDNRTGETFVDPASLDSDAPYGRTPTGRRKRAPGGRRATGKRDTGSRSAAQATGDIAQILAAIHWGMATVLKTPELELSADECQKGAESIARLTELYGDIPGMTEKAMAWTQFGMTWGTIYGTRFMAMKVRNKKPHVIKTGLHNVG